MGRAVEAISHSPFWDDTAFFILEDDAQNGADHVDAHRSIALVVSKYAPHGPGGAPFVDSRFYSTVSVIRTMEALLGLPPMNNNDAFCSLISLAVHRPGRSAALQRRLLEPRQRPDLHRQPKNAAGASASMKMDFSHEDRAPAEKLNVILWKDAMGNAPVPAMLKARAKKSAGTTTIKCSSRRRSALRSPSRCLRGTMPSATALSYFPHLIGQRFAK